MPRSVGVECISKIRPNIIEKTFPIGSTDKVMRPQFAETWAAEAFGDEGNPGGKLVPAVTMKAKG